MRSSYRTGVPAEPVFRRPWSLAGLMDQVMSFVLVTLVGWLSAILVEWVGMVFGWWELPGAGHSERLLRIELDRLKQDFAAPDSAVQVQVVDYAYAGAWQWYRWSGLEGLMRWIVSDQPSAFRGVDLIRAGLVIFGDYLLAAVYTTQLTGARLAVVVLSFSGFIAAGLVGVVDGLVQRDLRRFGGGLESGFLYHHLKKMIRPMVSVPILLYLASPWPVHPTLIFVPPMIAFGYFIQRSVSKFKKYL